MSKQRERTLVKLNKCLITQIKSTRKTNYGDYTEDINNLITIATEDNIKELYNIPTNKFIEVIINIID